MIGDDLIAALEKMGLKKGALQNFRLQLNRLENIVNSFGRTEVGSLSGYIKGTAGVLSSSPTVPGEDVTGTIEAAQDSVGTILVDTDTIDLTYNDAAPLIKGDVKTDSITNSYLANMAADKIKGRITAGTGDPEDLTAAQVRTIINVADGANVGIPSSYLDTDGTLSANSDTKVASQKATKTYADALASGAMIYKGTMDCSANPNYPAADAGDTYVVSVAGKIGGASGITVAVSDMFICNTDGTASGDQATVGSKWNVIATAANVVSGPASSTDGGVVLFDGETGKIIKDSGKTFDHGEIAGLTDDDHTQYIKHSLATAVSDFLVASGAGVFIKKTLAEVQAVLGLGTAAYTSATNYVFNALATAENDFLVASGPGVFVKKTLAETLTVLGKALASGLASLDASSKVVQNPANAQTTAQAGKIPIADGAGKLDTWVTSGGDVVGPSSAVVDNLVAFNSTTGKLIKDYGSAPTATPTASKIPIASATGTLNSWISVGTTYVRPTARTRAGILAAIATLPASGGTVFLPGGDPYTINTDMNISATGSDTTPSAMNNITLLGEGMGGSGFFKGSGSGTAYVGGATVLQWTKGSSGTLLTVNGRITGCKIENLVIDGGTFASTLIDSNRATLLRVNNVLGYRWTEFAVRIHNTSSNSYYSAGSMEQVWTNVHMRNPSGSSAHGLDIAPPTWYESNVYNVSECTFVGCSFSRSDGASNVGLRLGYCDHISFFKTFFCSDVLNDIDGYGIQINPSAGNAAYPQDITLHGSPIIGGVHYHGAAHGGTDWISTVAPAVIFYPFYTADSQIVPPADGDGGVAMPTAMCGGHTDHYWYHNGVITA